MLINAWLRRYEVHTEGDSFIVAFHEAEDALKWCFLVQMSLHDGHSGRSWSGERVHSPQDGQLCLAELLLWIIHSNWQGHSHLTRNSMDQHSGDHWHGNGCFE